VGQRYEGEDKNTTLSISHGNVGTTTILDSNVGINIMTKEMGKISIEKNKNNLAIGR